MVILLNGAIASGKTTIGKQLFRTLQSEQQQVSFYDLDEELKKNNPRLTWKDDTERLHDWLAIRKSVAAKSNNDLKQKKTVIIAGPFFTKAEIKGFCDYLTAGSEVYLFTLHVPIEQRLEREKLRKRNTVSVLLNQEQLLAELLERFGAVIDNSKEPDVTVMTIFHLIKDREGLLNPKQLQ